MRLLQIVLFIQLIFVGHAVAQNSLYNLIADSPDSIFIYDDLQKTELSESIIFAYSDNKISVIFRFWENNTWVNDEKIDRYLDYDFPKMKFDPLFLDFEIAESGESRCFTNYTLGDSLTVVSIWNGDSDDWNIQYKTNHYVSEEGIDTLAITQSWDSGNQQWNVEAVMKQEYVRGECDTVKVKIINTKKKEEIMDASFVFEYNEKGKIQKKYSEHVEYTEVVMDSMTYKNGMLDVVYNWNESEQVNEERIFSSKEEYMFDERGRKAEIHFWNQGAESNEWIYDGVYYFFYTDKATSAGIDKESSQISIYPNPSINYLNIKGYRGIVKISTLSGQVLKEVEVDGNSLDINTLNKGMYLLEFKNGITEKFIKK